MCGATSHWRSLVRDGVDEGQRNASLASRIRAGLMESRHSRPRRRVARTDPRVATGPEIEDTMNPWQHAAFYLVDGVVRHNLWSESRTGIRGSAPARRATWRRLIMCPGLDARRCS
jgi:hypothetical protein